ncbi:MAG TPA: nuclear transport factor 2 family protein [Acidimicrobiales bacterium]
MGHWHSADEVSAFMRAAHEPCGHTLHRITNTAISPTKGGLHARSYVDALVMMADDTSGVRAVGCYDDDLVRMNDGWRIARRHFVTVLIELVGQQPNALA